MATGKTALLRAQRRWADTRGVRYDALGCVHTLADNVRVPLDAAALAELARGSELEPGRTRPARFLSLCSSAALVVNVFDYWRGRDQAPLARALGVDAPLRPSLAFEAPLPTGLPGDPPTADVALERVDGRAVFIESKYSEWLVRRPRNKRVFKDKYFPPGEGPWAAAGLPRCQALASGLQDGSVRFKHLNAAQILKHALGIAMTEQGASTLMYLYFDCAVRYAATHRAELGLMHEAIVPEIDFRVLTYQALFAELRHSGEVDRRYIDYLERRYFS